MADGMKVCVSSVCWWGDDRLSVLKKAAAAGFEAVELMTFPAEEICKLHGDLRNLQASQLASELADHGLVLAGLVLQHRACGRGCYGHSGV